MFSELLYERRRNPNKLVSSENEGDDSNEARQAKIWVRPAKLCYTVAV